MYKSNKKQSLSFKHFAYGSIGLLVVLVAAIIILGMQFPKALAEENVAIQASERLGTNNYENRYVVYLYSANCQACNTFSASAQYQAFAANPGIRFYKINVDEEKNQQLVKDIGLTATPTLYLIVSNGKGEYRVEQKIEGYNQDALNLVTTYTKKQ